jgi:hypothetical protein
MGMNSAVAVRGCPLLDAGSGDVSVFGERAVLTNRRIQAFCTGCCSREGLSNLVVEDALPGRILGILHRAQLLPRAESVESGQECRR